MACKQGISEEEFCLVNGNIPGCNNDEEYYDDDDHKEHPCTEMPEECNQCHDWVYCVRGTPDENCANVPEYCGHTSHEMCTP